MPWRRPPRTKHGPLPADPADPAVLDRRPVRSPRVLAQEADGATVLLSLDQGTYFSLNEVGGTIWALCDGSRTVQDLVDAVCAEYDGPPAQVRVDVVALVHELASERLVEGVAVP